MKTRILKIVSNSMSLGVVRLTENALGNVNVELKSSNCWTASARNRLYAAIDAFLAGYQEPAGTPSAIWLEAV